MELHVTEDGLEVESLKGKSHKFSYTLIISPNHTFKIVKYETYEEEDEEYGQVFVKDIGELYNLLIKNGKEVNL